MVGTSADSSRRRAHVVVVGGGIAGLAAARHLLAEQPDLAVTLLEAGPQTGGKLRVGEVAGQPVDLGAEAMLNRRPEAVDLARAVGLADDLVFPLTTSAGIWTRDAVRPLPRTVMGIPADLHALGESGILTRPALSRAGLERRRRRLDVTEDVGIGRVVARRLGPAVRDRLVEPLLGGVYAGRADDLSLHATVPQIVPAIQEHGSLLAAAQAVVAPPTESTAPSTAGQTTGSAPAPAPVFAGIDGGVGRLASATDRAIRAAGGVVKGLTTVREIRRTETGFRLVCGPTIAPETVEADAVIIATPAAATARLLRDLAPTAAAESASVESASMAIVTLALDASADAHAPDGSGFLVPPADGRAIKAATFSSRKWGWHSADLLLVRCSIGRLGEADQLQVGDDELTRRAMQDLEAATGQPGRLVDSVVTRWGGALPQYTVGHLDRVRRIRDGVADVPGLAVCGAAYDGVGIPACIASATRAATQVIDHLRRREPLPT